MKTHVVDSGIMVPEYAWFGMGHSRVRGCVPRVNVTGTPLIRIQHIVDLVQNFHSRTRWRRTFKLIHGHPSPE